MTHLRLAIQRLCKTPGSSLAGILALALGIGLSGTMFSYVDLIYFKGVPFKDSKQVFNLTLVNVEQGNAKWYFPVSDFLTYREQQTTFTDLGAVKTEPINISEVDGAPADYLSSIISVNTLDLLGVQPILGRGFLPEEGLGGTEPVCLIGKRLWENDFGGSPEILEKHAVINNRRHQIIGVMAEGFGFPMMSDVWRPMVLPKRSELAPRGTWLSVFGRLKKEHSIAEATSEFEVIAKRLEQAKPETNKGLRGVSIAPFGEQMLGGGALQSMWLLVIASVGVLIIACANVANLLLVRSAIRAREMAVRAALGASRSSLIASVLVDSLTMAFIGAAGGIAVAYTAIELLAYYHPSLGVPYWWIVEPNWRFFSLIIGLTAVVALLAGLFPALRTTRFAVNDCLKENTSGAMGFSNGLLSRGLVVAQLAISCSLLGTAGMMVHNGMRLRNVDLPYDPSALLATDVRLSPKKFAGEVERRTFFERLLTGLRSRPDVAHAALVSHRGVYDTRHDRITVEGHEEQVESERPPARVIVASQGYFDTLGAPIIRGRDFRDSDGLVAVINAPMAEQMWPGQDAIGRRFRSGDGYPWLTVIGIAPDLQVGGQFARSQGSKIAQERKAGFYISHHSNPSTRMTVLLKSRGATTSAAAAVREELSAIDPTIPMLDTKTLRGSMDAALIVVNIVSVMFAVFGISAVLLAAVGLYGVISFAVSQRIREFGIRMAIGAKRRQIFNLVLRQGLVLVLIGLPIGIALGHALNRALASVLPLSPGTGIVWFTTVSALAATALLALLFPAWKATNVEPMEALRHE